MIEAYADEPWTPWRSQCECGEPKGFGAEACQRCTFLDGQKSRLSERIIDALRITDGMSISELCTAFGIKHEWHGRGGARAVQRALKRMVASGRLRRYWREVEQSERTENLFGQGAMRTIVAAGTGCWVYVLSARSQ